MGKKYIVEIGRLERLYKASISAKGMPNMTWLSPEVDLTPYTEPDLEQVKADAYLKGLNDGQGVILASTQNNAFNNGYKKCLEDWEQVRKEERDRGYDDGYHQGLSDAWEAARKIANMPYGEEEKAFGSGGWAFVEKHTASEAIEKIRQYEQEQEIEVGNEVAFHHDDGRPDTVVVVTYIGEDGFIDGMDGRGTQYAHKNPKKWTKTGRDFPELVEVLEKMRGENND